MVWNEVEDIKGVWIEEVIVYVDIVDVCVCVCACARVMILFCGCSMVDILKGSSDRNGESIVRFRK